MKQSVILAIILTLIGAGVVFAQEQEETVQPSEEQTTQQSQSTGTQSLEEPEIDLDDTATRVINVEDKYGYLHPTASNVTLQLQFTPLTGEVIFTYTCTQSSFDLGEAMNVAMAVHEDFARENQFKHKQYAEKDKRRYFKDENGVRMTTYTSKVIFTR